MKPLEIPSSNNRITSTEQKKEGILLCGEEKKLVLGAHMIQAYIQIV